MKFKKWIRVALIAWFLVSAILLNQKSSVVSAEEEQNLVISEDGSYIAEYVDDISEYRGTEKSAPISNAKGYEDWLFAGWFKASSCMEKEAVSKSTSSGGAWAKFVPNGLLDVKCQLDTQTQMGQTEKANMRLTSSVDTLNYATVGFQVRFSQSGSGFDCATETVYERIVSSERTNVAFEHNPKIVNPESRYLTTATLMNIAKEQYETVMLCKAYWVTLDGTKVLGQGRYVKVSDGLSDVVVIPVRTQTKKELKSLTVEEKEIQEIRFFSGETCGAIVISEDTKALASSTMYHLSNGVAWEYRNLYRSYQGTSDTTWYQSEEQDKYVLLSVSDLYGFAELVNAGNDFKGKTIYLGTDLVLNEGTSSEWEANAPANSWIPIGNTLETPFAGTFDGYMDTISGIYMKATTDCSGLFGVVNEYGMVSNLEIENSFYYSTLAKAMGSVVGYLRGNANTLYAKNDVYLKNTKTRTVTGTCGTGGIVGVFEREDVDGEATISNCWFAGKAQSAAASVSGILGHAYLGNLVLENCLNTGDITGTYSGTDIYGYVSGLMGGARSWAGSADVKVRISDCLTTGTVSASAQYAVGSAVGRVLQSTVHVENTYAVNKVVALKGQEISTDGTIYGFGNYSITAGKLTGSVQEVTEEQIAGQAGYVSLDLDYRNNENPDGVWAVIEGQTPELISFTEKKVQTDLNGVDRELVGWYYNAFNYYYKTCKTEDGIAYYPHMNVQTQYEISNADELRGLRKLVNEGIDDFGEVTNEELGKTVSNRIITLTEDIEVYEGDADEWAKGNQLPKTSWVPIGLNDESQKFAGTLDGNGHTISGVYAVDTVKVDGVFNYLGVFAITAPSSVIRDVKLTNSYFSQRVNDGFVGSIACDIQGVVDAIYSDAIVETYGQQMGGICARINGLEYEVSGSEEAGDLVMGRGSATVQDCWFDGEIRIKGLSATNHYVGGIAGVVVQGTGNITNSLFTGSIKSISTNKTVYIGGLIGSSMAQSTVGYQEGSYSTLNISNSISAGEIMAPSGYCGATLGRTKNSVSGGRASNTYTTLKNVFATRDCWQVAETAQANTTSGGVTATSEIVGTTIQTYETDRLIGYCKEESTKETLDFTTDWSMRISGVPIPKALEPVVKSDQLTDVSKLTKEIGLDYWSGSLANAVNYGVGNYVVSYSATKAKYQSYLTKLEQLGFTKYVDNSAGTLDDDGVYNAIYTKEKGDWVLHITYVNGESKVYVSVNTMGRENLSEHLLGASQEGTGDVMYAMLQLVNSSGYGNGFVFRLSNGHFIVIDGGMSADGPTWIKYLKALSDGGPVYIDAWIISHFHSDHSYGLYQLISNASLREGIYLEGIYASESSNYSKSMDSGTLTTVNNTYRAAMSLTKADGSKPDVVRLHMGERYYFSGLTMDIIQAQEQLPVDYYNDFSDPDKFNGTSTNCLFTVNKTGHKIFTGGDSTKANMNYIMKAYDGITATAKRFNEKNGWYTDTDPEGVTRTKTKTLSNINVFVAYHHGKNTTPSFTRYLVGDATDDYAFDIALFPFHQMMNPTLYESYIYSGTTYKNKYWMEDNSCVFNYKMEEVNEALLANVKQGFYTYGYEDSVTSSSASNWHGTVELHFKSSTIETRVLKSWRNGFTIDLFE